MNKFLNELKNNPYVREKDLGNGVCSYNYSNKAFYEGVWNNVTEKARGFFVESETEKVVARSFDKFFAVGERPETEMEELKKNMQFPVTMYRKENGFLGICSYREGEPDNLFLASKSTNQGDYAGYFRDIFYDKLNSEMCQNLAEMLHSMNCSAVFEVIDPYHDPHIVAYGHSDLVLLALIENDYEYHPASYSTLQKFAKIYNFKVKKQCGIAYSWDDFMAFYKHIKSLKGIEGVVFEDSAGFMLKLKTDWYKYWKRIRSVIHAVYKDDRTPEQIRQKYRLTVNDMALFNYLYVYVQDIEDTKELDNIPLLRDCFLKDVLPVVER